MSLSGLDNEFLFALRKLGEKRNERELNVIYSHLHRLETLSSLREHNIRALCPLVRYEYHDANVILFRKDDPCRCWYILLSGSVFIQGSMFLPYACFGKQIPGTKRRGCQCLVLEPSEMIAIDYPDMTLHTGGITTRPHAIRQHSTTNSSTHSTLDSVLEADTSSSEGSPMHQSRSNSLHKTINGGAVLMADNVSQSSFSKDTDGDDFDDHDLDEEDSISLHSTSSIVIKDLVIEVLKKDIAERNGDDLEILLEFTKSLRAFSNMTEPIRRALCKVMVFAWVASLSTVVLKDNELLDSWSVIINGQVHVKNKSEESILVMGDSFGVEPTLKAQNHKGVMTTMCDDCQFLCIAQQEYYEVLHQGQENIQNILNEAGEIVMVKEKREFENGTKKGNIVIRGNADSLMHHLLDENTIDATYTEDFLLTYRAFSNEPLKLCRKLLEWFDNMLFRDKVIRVILLWVNNHFNDFECDWHMMALLENFEEKLNKCNLYGETKLFNIACNAKAKPRIVSITRSCDEDLGFEILGGSDYHFPMYISKVTENSTAEAKGIKRGDQLLEVNGQNFEKLAHEKAQAILKKNTDLTLTLKTSLFAFKEMVAELKNPSRKSKKGKRDDKYSQSFRGPRVSTMPPENDVFESSKHKKGFTISSKTKKFISKFNVLPKLPSFDGGDSQVTVDDTYLPVPSRKFMAGSSATIDTSFRSFRQTGPISLSNPDLLDTNTVDFQTLPEVPEDVIKVYRADQTFRFIFVNRDTTAGDAVQTACKEFGITEDVSSYALYRVSVQGEEFVKQSKLPDPLSKLAEIPLGARYYLKNTMNSEQLLPDENIPELLKEANFSFLDLNCFEVALYLTREDYKLFQLTEPANFIEDLFHLEKELIKFKEFEDLVNRELFWVVTTICNESNVIQRSKIIKHFAKIAHHCKILKNLNSTFALISGLGYRAVSRMKQSWEKVPAKSNRLFEELQALMDPSRNMSKYRTLLNEYVSQPPVIPYIPVVKKDLTFLHLGNDTKVEGLINFEKMRMIGKEVRSICRLCAPDKGQIIPSAAAAQQRDNDRGAIYQTLARRGRRASFNNARRMYEDQTNVRRVRQYMKRIEIITDEDKLMEMSKLVEPQAAPSSTQPKRRHTAANALPLDSPSRSSKTLPSLAGRNGSTGSNSSLQSRNNSEPHLANVPGITIQPARKKTPSSTLPKYIVGPNSPQMITRKLMSLSEEAGDDKKGVKRVGKETKRSASVSSHEFSPMTSPYMSPKYSANKGNVEGNHTVGLENMNRNNNRLSLPAGAGVGTVPEPSSPGIQSAPVASKKFFPASNSSTTSSCRSSIASASSLGTISSSNPSTSSLGGNNSPRSSSPVPWSSTGSLSNSSSSASPRLLHTQHKNSNSPGRSSSSSSADTVKSAGTRHTYHERPVIKQTRNGRSSSFGGGSMMMSTTADRRLSQMSASTSSPTLTAHVMGTQPALILPNHPQIPRTTSIDSGVVSAGSLSADSSRFNPADENDIFGRACPHHSHFPQSQNHPAHNHPHPHRQHDNHPHGVTDRTQRLAQAPTPEPPPRAHQHPAVASRHEQGAHAEDEDKVEQTFLSGSRGQGDPPRPDNKDPFSTNLPLPTADVQVDRGKFVADNVLYQAHIPPGVASPPNRQQHLLSRSIVGKNAVKGIHEFLICERHAAMHNHYARGNANCNSNNNSNPMAHPQYMRIARNSPEALLEEQLVLELQKQKPTNQKPKRRNTPTYENHSLMDLKRLSLSKSDPSLNNFPEWPAYSNQADASRSEGVRLPPPANSSSPKIHIRTQNSLEQGSCISPGSDNVFMNLADRTSNATYDTHNEPNSYTSPLTHSQQSTPDATSFNSTSTQSGLARAISAPMPEHKSEQIHSWETPHQENHQVKSADSRTKLNATMPSVAEHYEAHNRTYHGPVHNQPLHNGIPSGYQVQHTSYDATDGSPVRYNDSYAYQQHVNEQWMHSQVRRKTSQEWSEIDLDGEKMQQTMRAWGSSTSLPATPLSTKYSSPNQPYPLPPRNLQPNLLSNSKQASPSDAGKKYKKPPPPPPPQRTSSFVRTKQIHQRLSSASSPLSSPPLSPSPPQGSLDDGIDPYSNSFEAAFHMSKANGHVPNHGSGRMSFSSPGAEQTSNFDRRSLPSYTEAVHQISAKQTSIFSSPLANTYRPFTLDSHENKEQVSQV